MMKQAEVGFVPRSMPFEQVRVFFEKVRFFHSRVGAGRVTLALQRLRGGESACREYLIYGTSLCAPGEQFNRKSGRERAGQRLEQWSVKVGTEAFPKLRARCGTVWCMPGNPQHTVEFLLEKFFDLRGSPSWLRRAKRDWLRERTTFTDELEPDLTLELKPDLALRALDPADCEAAMPRGGKVSDGPVMADETREMTEEDRNALQSEQAARDLHEIQTAPMIAPEKGRAR